MGYIEQNLVPAEEVVYQTKLHPIIFVGPILFVLLGLVLLVVPILGLLVIVIGLLLAVPRYIRVATSEFAVTNKRVLIKVGWVRRRTLEMLLTKVETIGVNQGLLGRMLNYGGITVTGTGGTREFFQGIKNPLEFRKQVQARIAG
jgi:uncharacterized membrane protein YdbT with pleckstrin-like domain